MTRDCVVCGSPFEVSYRGNGRRRRFCGATCRQRANRYGEIVEKMPWRVRFDIDRERRRREGGQP